MSTITLPLTITLPPETKALLAALRDLDPYAGPPITTKADAPSVLTPPASGEYWPGQGGHYICTLPALLGLPARHLIAGPECDKTLTFGPYDEVPGADSHSDGRANTAALLATGDLIMAHICARQLFTTEGYYWTSTQTSRNGAFFQDFAYGDSFWGSKGNKHRVRAFRVIQAT
jgi:hypothetical protein